MTLYFRFIMFLFRVYVFILGLLTFYFGFINFLFWVYYGFISGLSRFDFISGLLWFYLRLTIWFNSGFKYCVLIQGSE